MSNEPTLTVIGNLTDAPELRFLASGVAVASFTIASTPRTFDKATNEWKDGETLFMRCSIWREAAENVAESLTRGTRVIVTGRLKSRSYDKDGEKRTVIELDVDEVGPSLKYATAKVAKVERGQRTPDRAQGDAWATTPAMRAESAQQAASAGWGNQSSYDEPPF